MQAIDKIRTATGGSDKEGICLIDKKGGANDAQLQIVILSLRHGTR